MTPKVTVIVCTYNRGFLINETLPTLFNQDIDSENFDIIIVNNNSDDETSVILKNFQNQFSNIIILDEPKQGLSHAKNAGMIAAKTDWLIFLDDDAKVPIDFVKKAILNINNSNFNCFGGVYLPWYKYGKPKWYRDEYSSNSKKLSEFGILEKDYLSGGIMAIKKFLLMKYDGFSTHIGMKGNSIAYGEETLLQIQLRYDGHKIGYDPNWLMYHLVSKYKLTPWWFIISGYVSGRDSWLIYQEKPSFKRVLKHFYQIFKFFITNIVKYTPKLFNTNYFIQNWIINVLRPTTIKIGQVNGAIKIMMSRNG